MLVELWPTLGFRWSGVHNLFLTAGDLAADEWRAGRASEQELAEREMRQFAWCVPVEATKWSQTPLEIMELAARVGSWPRGVLPPDTKWLTAAVDTGKYLVHWALVAWRDGATGHVVDYGRIEVASSDLGVEQAIMVALREFRPDQVWVDAGYMTDVVYAFTKESGARFRPAIGRGTTQQRRQTYHKPTSTGSTVIHVGQGFHISALPVDKLHLVEVDADHWKTWLHQRLESPLTSPGALTFYQSQPQDHLALALAVRSNPPFPKAREGERFAAVHFVQPRQLGFAVLLPLHVAIRQHQAAALLECRAEDRFRRHGVAAGVDRAVADLGVLGPARDQAPI